jgi:hypothetical protein
MSRLDHFHSVLDLSDDCTIPVRTMHSSFRDYLLDYSIKQTPATRPFWVHQTEAHAGIARRCIATLDKELKRDICNLKDEATLRDEIQFTTIDHCLPPHLQYACRYWVHHVLESHSTVPPDVLPFLQRTFLYWVEAMSILNCTTDIVDMVIQLQSVIVVCANPTSKFLSRSY